MIISTTDRISDKEITEILDIVKGNSVRARHIGRDIFAGLKTIDGGEMKEYVKILV